ncbi:MAG: hypothetical protein AAF290_16020 [Pseudomonadota bacterium]
MTQTVTMYRPCGEAELKLVEASGFTAWPPRLPEQPIFYPVTSLEYAEEVNNWNVRQFGKGYVTRFEVEKTFADRYPIKTVGASRHTEWWIPAEDLDALNTSIVGKIAVISERSA